MGPQGGIGKSKDGGQEKHEAKKAKTRVRGLEDLAGGYKREDQNRRPPQDREQIRGGKSFIWKEA